jgi:cell shape-determining protein MreC
MIMSKEDLKAKIKALQQENKRLKELINKHIQQ